MPWPIMPMPIMPIVFMGAFEKENAEIRNIPISTSAS